MTLDPEADAAMNLEMVTRTLAARAVIAGKYPRVSISGIDAVYKM